MCARKLKSWDDGLQGPALEIAKTAHSPLLVLAGPGTGKTFTMMRRVARLLSEGVDPKKVLVCTFTRTAATDLKTSLADLGVAGVEDVTATTIHALSFGILSKASVMQITGRVPRPLLQFETRVMLEDLKGGAFGGIRECQNRLKAFDAAWARLQSDQPGWPQDRIDKAFHAALIAWLKFHEAILIGELVPEMLAFLRNNPMAKVLSRFQHVLVDEYQDLNRADQALIDLLAGRSTLSVIGDENQSIYSFRFAHPEGITDFPSSHANTHSEPLTECRRCPKIVVGMANSLISNNANRVDRPIAPFPANPTGEVHLVQWSNINEEAQGLAAFIKHRIDSKTVDAGKVLILAPRRQFGYAIRDALRANGTYAHSFFNEEALEESVAQEAFALLTLLVNPDDRVALRCWCGFGSPSYNSGAWGRLRDHCENTGQNPREALDALVNGRLKLSNTKAIQDRYRLLLRSLKQLDGLQGVDLLDALFPDGSSWAEPIRSLAVDIEEGDYEATVLRDRLLTGITQPELPTDVDYVRVMSLHKSKGLTADLVAVVGCIDGLIPTYNDDLTPAEQRRLLEEQRRLFYVAITRSTNVLVLSSVTRLQTNQAYRMRARVQRGGGKVSRTITSTFWRELGRSCPASVRGQDFFRRNSSDRWSEI